jgi:hypothetical protein
VVGRIDQQWQADLADMQAISRFNNGVHYILTVIDVFSKFAWVVPVKNKGAVEMADAFTELFKMAAPRKPEKIQTDAGKEFLNSSVQKLLNTNKIAHFVSNSDMKAAVVERFNRTLKTKLWTYFTAQQTNKYIDKLQDFVMSYNNSYHRSIGMKPADVRPKDQDKIWLRLYGAHGAERNAKVKIGDKVRISKVKGVFEKGYLPNWSEEHLFVKEYKKGKRRQVFKIKDDLGEDIKGEFYIEELQPTFENRYIVENILRKRKGVDNNKNIFSSGNDGRQSLTVGLLKTTLKKSENEHGRIYCHAY